MARIVASSVSRTWHRASTLASSWCAFRSGAAREQPQREAYEKQRRFKNGQRFRAGIEGRISVLFRGRGMKRCLAEGRDRFELWVGAAIALSCARKV